MTLSFTDYVVYDDSGDGTPYDLFHWLIFLGA